MTKKIIKENNFNEKEMAKKYFTFDEDIQSTYKHFVLKKELGTVYILITKYIINEYTTDPNIIRTLLRKHMALGVHLFSNKGDKIKPYLNNITFERLLNSKEEKAYNDIDELFFTRNNEEAQKIVINMIKKLKKEDKDNNTKVFLQFYYDYFYYTNIFNKKIDEITRFDLMISHCLFDEKSFMPSFIFQIRDEDANAFADYKSKQNHQFKELLLGHIINQIFIDDNFDYSKEMKFKKAVFYKAMIGHKDAYIRNFGFVEQIGNKEDNINIINKNMITKEFDFYYEVNGEGATYCFTKDGIFPKN